MNTKFIGASLLVLSLTCSPLALAHDKMMSDDKHHNMQYLNLSKDQQMKLETLKLQMMQKMHADKEELRSINMQIKALIQSPSMDNASLDSLIEKKKDILGRMMKEKITIKHQMYNLLTPEQKSKFDARMKEMELKMEKKRMEKEKQMQHDMEKNGNKQGDMKQHETMAE